MQQPYVLLVLCPHDASFVAAISTASQHGDQICGRCPSCTAVASDVLAADEFADVEGGEGVELDDDWGLDEDDEK
jgi:hypothetical protein